MMHVLHINSQPASHFDTLMRLLQNEGRHTLWNQEAPPSEKPCLIHAHSWIEDGSLALKMSEQQGIPYIISFAEDEVDMLGRWTLTTHPQWLNILKQASKIIIPSPNFEYALGQSLSDSVADIIFGKTLTIYNPIHPYFLQNLHLHKPVALVHIHLLYIACHKHYINDIDFILKAVKKVQHQNIDIQLAIADVGGYTDSQRIRAKYGLEVIGAGSEEARAAVYRQHDIVVMPGYHTHTTRYFAEALSQGLPVIYAAHSCFDGILQSAPPFVLEKESSTLLADIILSISQRYATIEQHLSLLHPLAKFNLDESYREYMRVYAIAHSLNARERH